MALGFVFGRCLPKAVTTKQLSRLRIRTSARPPLAPRMPGKSEGQVNGTGELRMEDLMGIAINSLRGPI
eukprot:166813-Pyramimonas_sp.AAC.1